MPDAHFQSENMKDPTQNAALHIKYLCSRSMYLFSHRRVRMPNVRRKHYFAFRLSKNQEKDCLIFERGYFIL